MTKTRLFLAASVMALAGISGLHVSGAVAQNYDQYGAPSDAATRLNELEEQIRVLTGRVEELTYKLNQTNNDIQNLKTDTDLRIQDLGGAPSGDQADGTSAAGTESRPGAAAAPAGGGGPINLQPPSRVSVTAEPDKPAAPSVTMPQGSPQAQYDFAIDLLKRGEFAASREAFKQFLEKNPDDDLAGNAQYWLGETYYVQGMYKDAADAFLKGYTTYSKSVKAPDSLLKLGMTLTQLGQKDAACATFGELGRRFPKASPAVVARNKQQRQKTGC